MLPNYTKEAAMPRFQFLSNSPTRKERLMRRCGLIVLLTTLTLAGTSATTSARPCMPNRPECGLPIQPTASAVVDSYFGALNHGMQTGDFSGLAFVYTADATLTQNEPDGHTRVVHGLAAITQFYRQVRTSFPANGWVRDGMRALSRTIVLSYEHTSGRSLVAPARSSHLFVITDGRIKSIDWTVYYAGRH
jgi:hypothetical protein